MPENISEAVGKENIELPLWMQRTDSEGKIIFKK